MKNKLTIHQRIPKLIYTAYFQLPKSLRLRNLLSVLAFWVNLTVTKKLLYYISNLIKEKKFDDYVILAVL